VRIKDGGPAFPAIIPIEHSDVQGKDYPNYSESGMTLRDYFAAKALQGWLADGLDTDPENAAEQAYAIADAMIAAREK
jgi:hypothetical protein